MATPLLAQTCAPLTIRPTNVHLYELLYTQTPSEPSANFCFTAKLRSRRGSSLASLWSRARSKWRYDHCAACRDRPVMDLTLNSFKQGQPTPYPPRRSSPPAEARPGYASDGPSSRSRQAAIPAALSGEGSRACACISASRASA